MPFLMELKIEPKTEADHQMLLPALRALEREDSTLRVDFDPESHEIILKGQSELHLDIALDVLKRQRGIAIDVGAPQVAYREVLKRLSEVEYTHMPRGPQPGKVKVALQAKPLELGAGDWFSVDLADDNVDLDVDEVQAVEDGIDWVRDNGRLIGFPLVDCEVTLKRLVFFKARAPLLSIKTTARLAMIEACEHAGLDLLEPVMAVTVTTPFDFIGAIIGNLNERRVQIRSQRLDGESCIIEALVPLANLFGYINDLRARSLGRADYTMSYSHYQLVPRNISGGPDDNFPPAVGKRA